MTSSTVLPFANPGLADKVRRIAEAIRAAGGRAWLNGGAVRDHLLGLDDSRDADLEVYTLTPDALEALLNQFGSVHLVGAHFAVLHLTTDHGVLEISLPRLESKTGPGHKGFEVTARPDLEPKEACKRRDFTVNAMLLDPLDGELLDFYGGQADIRRGVLRHVSPAFSEDPLRVMRAARFVSRFGWTVHPATAQLCRGLDLSELPRERLENEWRHILLNGDHPGRGVAALEQVGALRFFPELLTMRNVPQDPVWHPEGDVFHHTCLAVDAGVRLRDTMEDPWAEMLAILCHDLGKPLTTLFERGRWRSPNHDHAGEEPTRSFLARITAQSDLVHRVVALVREHLRPMQLYQAKKRVSDTAVRRLALRVDIPAMVRVALADGAGRGEAFPERWLPGEWLLDRAAGLGVRDSKPVPFLLGRDLMALGMPAGPSLGVVLREAFELQIEGELADREAALEWAKGRVQSEI